MRSETPPGHQAQFDGSPYTVDLGGVLTKLLVFGMTLGYSRRKHDSVSLDETQPSLFEAIERCLLHFGGAPKELLVDNARALVTDAHPTRFRWNAQFLEMCGHYRLQPRACQPYRARTKGNIERPFFSLEQQFVKGTVFTSFRDVQDRHEGRLSGDGVERDITFVETEERNDEIDAAFWAQCKRYPSIVKPEVRAATLGLVPRTTTGTELTFHDTPGDGLA